MSCHPPNGLNILMLHGYTQSGPRFHEKTRALEKAINKTFPGSKLRYPSGPLLLRPADIPGFVPSEQGNGNEEDLDSFAWWRRKDDTSIYSDIEKGLERVAETIRSEGPFDGVVGFSQGGAAAAIVASLLEPGRKEAFDVNRSKNLQKLQYPSCFTNINGDSLQPPLKFVVVYSGFAAPFEFYSAFYEPKIQTPVLHFLGSLDTVVDESRGRLLIESCEGGKARVVVHPGGHFVPSQKVWLDAAVNFLKECMGSSDTTGKRQQDESVEDMDVPF